jgi:hypothetical protein
MVLNGAPAGVSNVFFGFFSSLAGAVCPAFAFALACLPRLAAEGRFPGAPGLSIVIT